MLAAADLVYERWQHERDLRMTKDEVRREAKEQDVNPEVKGQLKRRQHEMAVRRMMSAVPDADVVITNPTHFAVALRYARALPGAAGRREGRRQRRLPDHLAWRARAASPSIQDPPLARSLFANAEVGQYIPADAFGAVAEILAHVYRATGAGAGRRVSTAVATPPRRAGILDTHAATTATSRSRSSSSASS